MAKSLRLPSGSTAWNDRQLRNRGEVTLDMERKQIRLHDAIQLGGHVLGGGGGGDTIIFEGGLRIIGKIESRDQLPPISEVEDGDTFILDGHYLTAFRDVWEDLGSLQGPQGYSAYDVAVLEGFEGLRQEWLASLRGADGIGLKVIGTRLRREDLPARGEENGDSYVVATKMYTWVNDTWEEIGTTGPPGKSAYQVALEVGDIAEGTSRGEWIDSLKGRNAYQLAREYGDIDPDMTIEEYLLSLRGKDAFEIALARGFVGNFEEWLQTFRGEKGDKGEVGRDGPQGKPAHAIKVIGRIGDPSELPSGAEAGDAYYHGLNLWTFDGSEWVDLGEVVGPQGEQGEQGLRGERGLEGPRGYSAYEVAINQRVFSGSEREWLDSLSGLSAFEIARRNDPSSSFSTEEQWLATLVGKDAFEIMRDRGEVDNYDDWLAKMQGPQGERGLQGPQGRGLAIKGIKSSTSQLPVDATESDTYLVGEEGWIYLDGTWQSMGSIKGPKGDKGEKGDPGLTGPMGTGLVIKGYVDDTSDLPNSANHQDAYLVKENLFIYLDGQFHDAGRVRGPEGQRGDKGVKGDRGERGPQGPRGTKGSRGTKGQKGDKGNDGPQGKEGPAGIGIKLLGVHDHPNDLPSTGVKGDTFLIGRNAWTWQENYGWRDLGPIEGPQGKEGPQGLRGDKGDKGDVGDRGPAGNQINVLGRLNQRQDLPPLGNTVGDGYLIDGELWAYTQGQSWQNLGPAALGPEGKEGPVGPKGPEGPEGPRGRDGESGMAVTVMGRVARTSDLPQDVNGNRHGDGYLVGQDLWIWTANKDWTNVGPVAGPRGDIGPRGLQGLRGERGLEGVRGKRGTVWLHFERDPNPIDGEQGDYAVNVLTNAYFNKVDGLSWQAIGHLGGGTVEEAPVDDLPYIRRNGEWQEAFDAGVDDVPDDNLTYLRRHQQWVAFNGLTFPANDGKTYQVKDGRWVEAPAKDEAPSDGHGYVRKDGKWERPGQAWVKATYTAGTLFIDEAQAFRVNVDRERTISFNTALPSDYAFTLVVTLIGNGGNVTWPNEIRWVDNVVPTGSALGSEKTLVTLYWDGDAMIGSITTRF